MKENYCEDCGELQSSCVCHLIQYVEYQEPDFKFEFAHESCTEGYSKFKVILPLYD